jgi:signal transduction histidine kinase
MLHANRNSALDTAVLLTLDAAGVAFALFDGDGMSVETSRSFDALSALPTEAQRDFLHDRVLAAVSRALSGEDVDDHCDLGGDGEQSDAHCRRLTARRVDGADATRVVVWLSDSSDAARAEAHAKANAARAAKAEAAKDQFLATLSHELRTPLATILGWTQLLKSRSPDATTIDGAMATIDRAARAQLRLIDDILVAARVVAGALRLERRKVDVALAVSRAAEAVRATAESKDVRLQMALEDDCFVDGDPGKLEHVAFHLLGNAIKFSARGGSVRVLVGRDRARQTATISVSDDGVGIVAELLPRVFDRFTQGESGLTRAHGGLGLGLSLARHLVEAHGGSIDVESEGPGRGTTVLIRMPLAS